MVLSIWLLSLDYW